MKTCLLDSSADDTATFGFIDEVDEFGLSRGRFAFW